MDVLYLLVPLSVLAILGILAVFAWALQAGQFDEIESEGARILEPEEALLDAGQAAAGGPPQQ